MLIPLVARAGVLAEVDSVLAAARAGRGALLTVTGEPGIGKTRLAEEAAERAGGFEVVWTWGPAAAGGAALGPWSRVLRVLAGGHAAVARLIADSPFLAALTQPARAGGGRDPEGARSQLSVDLAEVIATAAARRPVLVVFDDAHQADTSSLWLLAELAPALRTMPAAVLVALVTARLSIASTLLLPDARRLELAAEAVSQARSADDDAALAAALAALCDAVAGPDHCAARRAHATEIIDLAERLRDPVLGLLGRRLRLVALLEAGAIADWEADVLAYRAAAEALRHPLYTWYVPLWRGMRALGAGRFDECRAALAEAAAIGERAASGNAIMLVQTQLWCLRAEEGDTAGLLDMLDNLETVSIPAPWLQITRALVLAQVGRTEDARTQLEAVIPLLPALARDSEWLPAMAQVAETIALTGPHQVARWAYDALSPYAGLVVVEGICAAVRGPVHRHLALLADALGEHEAAAAHRRSAVADERDALVEALTGAYGLGGRVRRSGSAAERARTAVTARIRDSIRRIADAHPDLGRHLARSVRTGTFCVYEPDQPVRWSL